MYVFSASRLSGVRTVWRCRSR